MIERHITEAVRAALRDTPVVLLHGPRQSGKSTLAHWITVSIGAWLERAHVLSREPARLAVLARRGRGGRRWAFLTLDQERELLAALQAEAGRGQVLTAKQIHGRVRQAVGKKVSLDYVYRLLHRHGWRKRDPRSRHVKADPQAQAEFKKNFRNSWPRH
jgi:transposase